MKRAHLKRYWRIYLAIGGILSCILLLIWSNMVVPYALKVILSISALAILLSLVAVAYRHAMRSNEDESAPSAPALPPATERISVVPPMPAQLPKSAAQPAPPATLYDHRPKPIPAIGYSLLVVAALTPLCILGACVQTGAIWAFVVICGVIATVFSYWQWIKWRGVNLIITEDTKQLQRALPWPFEVHAPAMPNKIGTVQDVKQTFLDRLFGTCTLFSDIKAEGDEVFHNIKWLPYPDELRRALGQRPLRRNSWLPFSRKKF